MSGLPAPRWPGIVAYEAAWELQRECAGRREEALFLLEHPAVYTLGKFVDAGNVLEPGGTPVVRTDRGGDVTWHGPGQLVGYPVLDLRKRRIGVHEHVLRIERAIVAALGRFGIEAVLRDDCVGVWTSKGKIASLGVRVAQGMSMHGFALNVANGLDAFRGIHPCGLAKAAVTSMREHGSAAGVAEAGRAWAEAYAAEFRFAPSVRRFAE